MPGTILVREALSRAAVLLNDASPVLFNRFPQASLIGYLNDAGLAIVKFLPSAGSCQCAIKLRPGSAQSIETIAPADAQPTPPAPIKGLTLLRVVCNMGSDGVTEGRAVRLVDQRTLDAVSPDWRLAANAKATVTSVCFDPQVPREFAVTPPVPATGSVWVRAMFVAQPVKLTAASYLADAVTVIPLPDEHIDDLVNYIVARANMIDSEWADANKAAFFSGLFLNSLNGKVASASGSNPNLKKLPFAPQPLGAAA